MQKAFERIIERLEEETYDMEICEEQFDMNSPYFKDVPYKMVKMDDVKKIVNKVAEEMGVSKMESTSDEVCEWELSDDDYNLYETSCGNLQILMGGSPIDNKYLYCPYCGKKIKVVE